MMRTKMNGIGVGVVGLGALGCFQARKLLKTEGVAAIVGTDPSPEARAKASEEFKIQTFDDLGQLLARPEVRLVLVSSTNDAHADAAVAALEAGKAVLLQKPMATTLEDCQRIVRAAERPGAFLQVGFECRYSVLYQRIKEIVDAGEIGEIRDLGMEYCPGLWDIWLEHEGAWKYDPARSGGMVLEKLSHYVDLMRWWTGRAVTSIETLAPRGVVPYFRVLDNLRMNLAFEGGATGAIHFSFTRMPAVVPGGAKPAADLTDMIDYLIVGTTGSLSFNNWFSRLNVVRYVGADGRFVPTVARVEDYSEMSKHKLVHDNTTELADVVRRVAEGRPPMTDPYDSLETMRACLAAEESARAGRRIQL
jgi:predicted dehydrogenase